MSVPPVESQPEPVPDIQGHVIGFVDSVDQCKQIVSKLYQAGINPDRVMTLSGDIGLDTFRSMLRGYSWGEESEQISRAGEIEFGNHHVVLCVEADRDEGVQIAETAQANGGHGFRHFGVLTDERLTA